MDLTKFNEAKLERLLDELYEQGQQDSEQYAAINAELDNRANKYTQNEEAIKESERLAVLEEVKAKLKVLKETIAQKWNMSVEDWDSWARSLYIIDDNYTVTSRARQWNDDLSWSFGSEYEAIEKVEQLLNYKYYDHFLRTGRK